MRLHGRMRRCKSCVSCMEGLHVEGLVLTCCVVLIVGWDCWMGK